MWTAWGRKWRAVAFPRTPALELWQRCNSAGNDTLQASPGYGIDIKVNFTRAVLLCQMHKRRFNHNR
jgi:hypothetical protein